MRTELEIEAIFRLLKLHLKSRKLSYRDLAKRLKMSESNLKRIFSIKSCGLDQMMKICNASDISFFDLVSAASKSELLSFKLSPDTENFFLHHFDHFIFFRNISSSPDPNEFIRGSQLPKQKLDLYLESLEKLKLIKRSRRGIELCMNGGYLDLPKNSKLYKMLSEQWVPWFMKQVLLNQNHIDYSLQISSTGLNKTHRDQLVAEVDQLIERYREIGSRDQKIGSAEFSSVGICVAIGPHRVGLFENLADSRT